MISKKDLLSSAATIIVILLLTLCGGNTITNAQTKGKAFAHYPIPDSVFARMQGRSYRKGCTVKRSDLRLVSVLHVDAKGDTKDGLLVCHRDIADDAVAIFRELYEAKYPIESIRLIDDFDGDDNRSMEANNTSCFNFRPAVGSSRLSKHATGHAIDINPRYNPYVKTLKNDKQKILPANGKDYANRNKKFAYKIERNDACHKAFTKRGFRWGGAWKSLKDWQHFER